MIGELWVNRDICFKKDCTNDLLSQILTINTQIMHTVNSVTIIFVQMISNIYTKVIMNQLTTVGYVKPVITILRNCFSGLLRIRFCNCIQLTDPSDGRGRPSLQIELCPQKRAEPKWLSPLLCCLQTAHSSLPALKLYSGRMIFSTSAVGPIWERMASMGLYTIGDSSSVSAPTEVVKMPSISFLNWLTVK